MACVKSVCHCPNLTDFQSVCQSPYWTDTQPRKCPYWLDNDHCLVGVDVRAQFWPVLNACQICTFWRTFFCQKFDGRENLNSAMLQHYCVCRGPWDWHLSACQESRKIFSSWGKRHGVIIYYFQCSLPTRLPGFDLFEAKKTIWPFFLNWLPLKIMRIY